MRFHIGCSFSLKKFKKFIFPILFGIISYFLSSGLFGFINVYAFGSYDNYSSNYTITYPELDLTSINIDDTHSVQEFLNDITSLADNSTNYDVIIGITPYPNFNQLDVFRIAIFLYHKGVPTETGFNSFFGGRNSSNSYFYSIFNYNVNTSTANVGAMIGFTFEYFPFGSDYTQNNQILSLKSCLQDNECTLTFNNSRIGLEPFELVHNSFNYDNNSSYNIDLSNVNNYYHSSGNTFLINSYLLYYSSFPITLLNDFSYSNNTLNNYFKSVIINGNTYTYGDRLPTYCEIFNLCVEEEQTLTSYNYLDDLFVSNIPVNNYSNLEVKFSLDYFNVDFPTNLRPQGFFYGRVNNGTYYSYESISCTLTGGTAYSDYKLLGTYGITGCPNDLSRYDSLIFRLRMTSSDLITNFSYSSNLGHINMTPVKNWENNVSIMDYFGSLPPDFSLLVSSTEKNSKLEFIGSEYTFSQRIDKTTNEISSLALGGITYFGTNTNSNIMLYNYTLENNNDTDLYLFISDNCIVSFSDNGAYTYYDETDTLETQNIVIKYLIDISGYDTSNFLDIINGFLNDFEVSLIDCHTLFNSLYNGLPSFVSYLILVFYTLGLLYLLYKMLRR